MVSQDAEDGTLGSPTRQTRRTITANRPRLLQLLVNLLGTVRTGATPSPTGADIAVETVEEPRSQAHTNVDHGTAGSQTKSVDAADGDGSVNITVGAINRDLYVPTTNAACRKTSGYMVRAGYDRRPRDRVRIGDRRRHRRGPRLERSHVAECADGGARFEFGVELRSRVGTQRATVLVPCQRLLARVDVSGWSSSYSRQAIWWSSPTSNSAGSVRSQGDSKASSIAVVRLRKPRRAGHRAPSPALLRPPGRRPCPGGRIRLGPCFESVPR